MRIRCQILGLFAAVALLPSAIIVTASFWRTAAEIDQRCDRDLQALAERTAAHVDAYLSTLLEDVRSRALLPCIRDYLTAPPETRVELAPEIRPLLVNFLARDPVNLISCAILDGEGRVLLDSDPQHLGRDESLALCFREPLRTGLPFACMPTRIADEAEAELCFGAPVRDPLGSIVGVLRMTVESASLQQLMVVASVDDVDSEATLLDAAGLVLADGRHADLRLRARAGPTMPGTTHGSIRAVPWYGESRTATEPGYAGIVPLEQVPWRLMVWQPAAAHDAPVQGLRRQTLLQGCAVALLTLLATWLASRAIAAPIQRLERAARAIADGAVDVDIPIGGGEVGSLGTTLKLMTSRLGTAMIDLEMRARNEQTVADELRKLSSAQRALLDNAAFAIISTGLDGVIRSFNRGAERMLGYEAHELVGRSTPEVLHDPGEITARGIELARAHGTPAPTGFEVFVHRARAGEVDEREWTYVRKDQSRVPVLLSVTAVRDLGGELLGFMGIAKDITQEKLERAALDEAMSALEVASRAKSQFLANMSHELRTPMTAILGFTELLQERCGGDPEAADQLGTVVRNARHMLTLINDVLDLAKIESGTVTLQPDDFDPMLLARETVAMLQPRAAPKGVQLRAEAGGPVAQRLHADSQRLRQVLLNLVSNAVKFTTAGEVVVRLDQPEPGVLRVAVRDTGCGIDPLQQTRLFEAFVQVDDGMSRLHGGTGLGLAISRRLVRLMGGDIVLQSEPGSGSTFTVTVQVEPQQLPSPTVAQGVLATAPQLGGRVLLVDDGLDNQRLLSTVLEKAGAEVQVADNGLVALALLSDGGDPDAPLSSPPPFDLVLMDMQMPVLDGFAATRRMRQKGCTLPVIALTAHAMAGAVDHCLDAGCDDYASKPINRQELVALCARWLDRTRGRATGSLAQ